MGDGETGRHAFSFYSWMGFTFTAALAASGGKLEDRPPQNKDNMIWYYAQADQRQGPVSEADFEALIARGTITENTLVWKDGMENWAPLKVARPAGAPESPAPEGWIRCTATGRFFPPEEIVFLEGKPYSAEAKAAVLQNVLQRGTLPVSDLGRTGPAWENIRELGFFTALWQTIHCVLTAPVETFATMKREGGLGTPLGYYVLLGTIGNVVNLIYTYFHLGTRSFFTADAPALPSWFGGWVIAALSVAIPFVLVLESMFMAGLFHFSLMFCQGARQAFETTFRSYCYMRGSVMLMFLIPKYGGWIALVWWIVGLCIALAQTHEIETGRAVLAVVIPIVVCAAVIMFFLVLILGTTFADPAGFH
jgi:hypothetical protein